MRTGNLFVISGPSGVGKGTLVGLLLEAVDDAWLSVSATSRKPREGEVDGVQYHFLTKRAFRKLIAQDQMLEWAEYSGNLYGTPREPVEEHVREGKQAILEIEVQGAFQVREKMPEAHLVFIEPPSMEELERRLRGRGTDSEEAILKRLETAAGEMEQRHRYDFCIVNDDLEKALSELIDYVNAQAEL